MECCNYYNKFLEVFIIKLTLLEKQLLKVEPIEVSVLLRGVSINEERSNVTNEELYRIENDLENRIDDLKTKINKIINSLNILIDRQSE